MKTILSIIGTLIIVFGILFSLYVGIWYCFIGGIVDFIHAVQHTPIDAMAVALSILKFFVKDIVAVALMWFFIFIGGLFLAGAKSVSYRNQDKWHQIKAKKFAELRNAKK